MQDTKTAQHTPGPWPLERTTVNMGGFNVAVFRVTIPDWTPLDLMNEPDARLIAAAPDLLEALQALMRQTNNIEVLGEWAAEDRNHATSKKLAAEVEAVKDQARTAISKALGVQS